MNKSVNQVDLDWESLGFAYIDTGCHIRYTWKDGAWDEGRFCSDPYMPMHIAATALHYGQAAFEGLKAFSCQDGSVRVFRPEKNAERMASTARRVLMPEVPTDLFLDAVHRVVARNLAYVPPYGTGGSLYIRPLLIGSGPQIGVHPSQEYTFLILVLPVGDYYKGGLQPVSAVVIDGYDRAAPQGVGSSKVAGNYAASLEPAKAARALGYPINLYLDARENRYIDEFGTSNFIGITADNCYVTPKSSSILPSITNRTLMALAEEAGMRVEERPVAWEELASFTEIGACGTAVVITPVNHIVRGDQEIRVGPAEGCGPQLQALYNRVRAIQVGEEPDIHGWCIDVAPIA
jgi:branched-chain amino acid aminotransferase